MRATARIHGIDARRDSDVVGHGSTAATSIALCLFDLDQTLLRTEDLEEDFRGSGNLDAWPPSRVRRLEARFRSRVDRHVYSHEQLDALRRRFPDTRWGVFTRAPRQYASLLLSWAYPRLDWSCLVAREDVRHTKPAGEGVRTAMAACGVRSLDQVMLVGDGVPDVRAGYDAGCWSVLDRHSWARRGSRDHVPALALVPDALVDGLASLEACLADPHGVLPELEYQLLVDAVGRPEARFDRVYHEGLTRKEKVLITTMGRYFVDANYRTPDGAPHTLSRQIRHYKSADRFPTAWIRAIRTYLLIRHERQPSLVAV